MDEPSYTARNITAINKKRRSILLTKSMPHDYLAYTIVRIFSQKRLKMFSREILSTVYLRLYQSLNIKSCQTNWKTLVERNVL